MLWMRRSGREDKGKDMEYYRINGENRMIRRGSAVYTDLEETVNTEFAGTFAWILFWEQYRVDFAWYDGHEFHWPEEKRVDARFLLEARIFNQEKEVVLRKRKAEAGFQARILEETDGSADMTGVYAFEEEPCMWGSKLENGCISEERGMQYHLPFTTPSEEVTFGYRIIVYRVPDPADGMLQLLDYRINGIYQKIGTKKQFLREGR